MNLTAHPLIQDWLGVSGDTILVKTGKVDIGQRITTALAQIAHEELTVPFDRIKVLPVRTGQSPDEGMTSGSNSIQQSGWAVRLAAATLRREIIVCAAGRLGGAVEDWELRDGALSRRGVNRPVPLVELIGDVDLAVAVDPDIAVRPAPGHPPRPLMRGLPELVRGHFAFVHDLDPPGMRHARVVRPPHVNKHLEELPEKAKNDLSEQEILVVEDGSFLAVAGESEWAVVKAARRLANACRWSHEDGPADVDVFTMLRTERSVRLVVENGSPRRQEPPPPLERPEYAARYERPFTMHAALGPSAALATWDGETLNIVTHSQGVYPLRESLAETFGLAVPRVVLEHAPGAGCYGHNGADDAALDAALVAMALPNTPILLKWTRDDEHAWEPYGPPQAVELAATFAPDGSVAAFSAEAIGGTYRGRPRSGPNKAGPARLLANGLRRVPLGPYRPEPNMNKEGGIHRNLTPAYVFAKTRLVKNLVADVPHRTSALRCLGAGANVFALESFMDELAHESGRDPVEFRRAHLNDPRGLAVIDRLRETMDRVSTAGDMAGCGVAFAQYKNALARVGVGVHIEMTERAEILLKRAVIVADAGRVIDHEGLCAQLEGGFLQGASWALYEQVTWDRSGITSRDWETYPVIRFDNVPQIDVVVLDGKDHDALGAGEASPGPTLAAIANALFDATGLRLRRLPLTPDAVLVAAAAT